MKIVFPNISQIDFEYAFECLEECKQSDAAEFGFNHPYFAPGGQYGKQWWQLDSSLALAGYKWADRGFSETALLNFIESQKENGRICLYGFDVLPEYVAGNNFPKQHEGVSSLPKIFDVAYNIVKCSKDITMLEKTYTMLKRYIDWWYSDRFDIKTGLFSAVFEETFIPYLGKAMEYAPVDTNVEIYVGLVSTSKIAARLKKDNESKILLKKADELKTAINEHLWDEEKGAYYPYDLQNNCRICQLMASTFYPLRMKIASSEQKKSLIALLKNDEHFNWNTIPLTSVSKKDPTFTTTVGSYQGNASWSGNVWTLINEMVVRGLSDSGENELAAELALKTIYAFNANCTEFINPFDGTGHGVLKYAWTASQYIELIVEVIFGIGFDEEKQGITVLPNLPQALKDKELSLQGVQVCKDTYLDVFISQGNVRWNLSPNCNKAEIYL